MLTETRCEVLSRLRAAWQQQHGSADWEGAIAAGSDDPLLFALATYDVRPKLVEQLERLPPSTGFSAEVRLS